MLEKDGPFDFASGAIDFEDVLVDIVRVEDDFPGLKARRRGDQQRLALFVLKQEPE